MRHVAAAAAIAVAILFGSPTVGAESRAPAASATVWQAQAPDPEPTAAPEQTRRPWHRLAIFVPVSVLLGAAAVAVRRLARERGLIGP